MTKYALLISIQTFDHQPPLPLAHRYTQDLRRCLIEVYGHQEKNAVVMQDVTGVPDYLRPTELNILQQIRVLVNNASDGDYFFLYYSGHGSQIPSSDDNEWDGADERQYIRVIRSSAVTRLLTLLKEIATTDGKWIIDNRLHDELIVPLENKKVRLFAFFDCCHSETMLDLGRGRKYSRKWGGGPGRTAKGKILQICRSPSLLRAKMSPKDKVEPQLLPNNSVDTLVSGTMSLPVKQESSFRAISLSACGDGQLAYDDMYNGVTATKNFVDLIKKKKITWEELRTQMGERTKEVLRQNSRCLPARTVSLNAQFDERMQHPRYDFSTNTNLTEEVDF
ncbi:hypothetical protein SCLCIDRAFT_31138 [Scleroderma citrinum Foug A]|uniref:Peptidase C14 caspase domain-containing protein n=1 Tax=Scleroderma citrinum Foug A TaxID=1036808 RepID=A0A0C3DD68_9AGAM|nr:hypothetical protein SCLCIDRAFT_31138 [Scleroderma citrinum Foug A]